MVIYLIVNEGKKFVWLDVKGVKDPLSYIRKRKLCPKLFQDKGQITTEILATPKNLTVAEEMYARYKRLLKPEYNA